MQHFRKHYVIINETLIKAFEATWRTPYEVNVVINDEIALNKINFYRERKQNIYDRLVCNPRVLVLTFPKFPYSLISFPNAGIL